ncbi:unnamed protein product [Phytophthora lilii]|uniref:Unnamed protein product n=1 Tax=Phytophthora lilii TaxID=2077276 RepID=A0A9W6TZ31_9STRA|nr:unnamed protein product [Phytophthora lilii]
MSRVIEVDDPNTSTQLGKEQCSKMLNGGPKFSIACKESSAMTPLDLKGLLGEDVELSLPSSDEIQTRPKKRPTSSNTARDEAQYELAFLREQVAELELHLKKLQFRPGCGAEMSVPRSLVQVPRVWKDIASRQRRRRDKGSPRKCPPQAYCRAQAEDGDRIGHTITQVAFTAGEGKSAHSSVALLVFWIYRGTSATFTDFHDLFQHVQRAFREADAVFAASGLSMVDISTSDVHVRDGVDGKYIEIFANKLLPFSLRDTGDTAWDHFKGVEKHFDNGALYEKAAKEFTKVMFSNNSRADVKIVQRMVGPDRDMVVMFSSVRPTEIKLKPLEGLVYHAREYVLIKSFGEPTPEHELLLQLHTRVSFDADSEVVYDTRHVRSVAQFLVGYFVGNLRCFQQQIENALIDRALRRQ